MLKKVVALTSPVSLETSLWDLWEEDPQYRPVEISTGKSAPEMGTDGKRGRYAVEMVLNDATISPATAYRLGLVAALRALKEGARSCLIGMDTRESGPDLRAAFITGLHSLGVDAVIDGPLVRASEGAGVTPTTITQQTLYLAEEATRRGAGQSYGVGVNITASHNSHTDNGIKLMNPDGTKFEGMWIGIANQVMQATDLKAALQAVIQEQQIQVGSVTGTSKVVHLNGNGHYIRQVVDNFLEIIGVSGRDFDLSQRFVVDLANGAAVAYFERILRELEREMPGIRDCFVLIHKGDGRINDFCGVEILDKERILPAAIQNRGEGGNLSGTSLQVKVGDDVRTLPFDKTIMLSFDGDADRLMISYWDAATGGHHMVDGDQLCLFNFSVVKQCLDDLGLTGGKFGVTRPLNLRVVHTVMASQAAEQFIRQTVELRPEQFIRTVVGDRFVHALAHGSDGVQVDVGAYSEQSGHYALVFSEHLKRVLGRYFPTPQQNKAFNLLNHILAMQNRAGGDAIQSAFMAIALAHHAGISLSQLNDPNYFYRNDPSKLWNIKLPHPKGLKSTRDPHFNEALGWPVTAPDSLVAAVNELQSRFPDYRIVLRVSGTEGVVRVFVEGPERAQVDRLTALLARAVLEDLTLNPSGHAGEGVGVKYKRIEGDRVVTTFEDPALLYQIETGEALS